MDVRVVKNYESGAQGWKQADDGDKKRQDLAKEG
jgi:hypothetical protein